MSKVVRCGDVLIGGDNPIAVQSMINADTRDERAALNQIAALADAGCDIVRLAVPDLESADAFGRIKKKSPLPMVADIHFDYRLAVEAIRQGADKIRINPGNIGDRERVKAVADAARERGVPIRVGVNSGSLEKEILEKYGGVTAEGIVESALKNIRLLTELDFTDIVVSIKSSNLRVNHESHLLLAEKTGYARDGLRQATGRINRHVSPLGSAGTGSFPIHIGLTEAGTAQRGGLKSAMGLGALLLAGIGDTMRVSLTGDPVQEVIAAREMLKALGDADTGIDIVSCPTCGRTRVDLVRIAGEIEAALAPVEREREREGLPRLTVAVMGCAVNGPGEAAGADLGVACGDGKGLLFSRGKILKTVPEDEIAAEIIRLVKEF